MELIYYNDTIVENLFPYNCNTNCTIKIYYKYEFVICNNKLSTCTIIIINDFISQS